MGRVVALTFIVILGLITGCSSTKSTTSRPGALDVGQAPIPSAEPVASAQPISDSQPIMYSNPVSSNTTAAIPASSTTGGSKNYTVKKGDTLFSISKANYGTGKDWQKIASANPGLTPQNLKAGQKITIP